jgi:hypothetical protein
MSNSTKRLQNSVAEYESTSEKKVPPRSCYVVRMVIHSDEVQNIAKIFCKEKIDVDDRPLAVYYYSDTIYLLFSPLESNLQHHFSGSHHSLCSFYSSLISKKYQCDVKCSIIELDTKTKVLTYFHVKIYESTKKTLFQLANGGIKDIEIDNLTLGECIKIVETKTKKKWSSFPSILRHGIFYKYRIKDGKEKLATFSDFLNLENTNKFEAYLFAK